MELNGIHTVSLSTYDDKYGLNKIYEHPETELKVIMLFAKNAYSDQIGSNWDTRLKPHLPNKFVKLCDSKISSQPKPLEKAMSIVSFAFKERKLFELHSVLQMTTFAELLINEFNRLVQEKENESIKPLFEHTCPQKVANEKPDLIEELIFEKSILTETSKTSNSPSNNNSNNSNKLIDNKTKQSGPREKEKKVTQKNIQPPTKHTKKKK